MSSRTKTIDSEGGTGVEVGVGEGMGVEVDGRVAVGSDDVVGRMVVGTGIDSVGVDINVGLRGTSVEVEVARVAGRVGV